MIKRHLSVRCSVAFAVAVSHFFPRGSNLLRTLFTRYFSTFFSLWRKDIVFVYIRGISLAWFSPAKFNVVSFSLEAVYIININLWLLFSHVNVDLIALSNFDIIRFIQNSSIRLSLFIRVIKEKKYGIYPRNLNNLQWYSYR